MLTTHWPVRRTFQCQLKMFVFL